ncbi:MAG: ABC transporter substrate-binding protein [Deltaproteobacteria bacterium]|nr:ABC transporter substrate-binding protein [Deltaproteobacteria bacterium]
MLSRLILVFYNFMLIQYTIHCEIPNEVKIGVIAPLTGPGARVGEILKSAIDYFDAKMQPASSIKFKFIVEDTQSKVQNAIQAFRKLTEIDKVVIVFVIFGSHGMALKNLAEKTKTILWSFTIHPDQTAGTKYVLRHNISIKDDLKNVESFIKTNKVRRLVTIYSEEEIGVYYDKSLSSLTKELQISYASFGVLPGDPISKTLILRALNEAPDAVYIQLLGSNIGVAIKEIRNLGFKGPLIVGPSFLITPETKEIARNHMQELYYTKPVASETCVVSLKQFFGSSKPFSAYSCYPLTSLEILRGALNLLKLNLYDGEERLKLVNYIKNMNRFFGTFETVDILSSGDIVSPVELVRAEE